ncbi:hypothetical protein DNTS_000633, partial [Danionella cerebrum]
RRNPLPRLISPPCRHGSGIPAVNSQPLELLSLGLRMVRKNRTLKPCSALKRLSLLDRISPEPPESHDYTVSQSSAAQVYLQAAALFQLTHLEKPSNQRLICFGKRSEGSAGFFRTGDASQRAAYQLAFNTLKYQQLLEDVLIDSCFCVSQPMVRGRMSLVAVVLTDLLDRKFLPRLEPTANQEPEPQEVKAVREVEASLMRIRTRLVASLARCRIKHELLTLDQMLPESIQHQTERESTRLLYTWINTLLSSEDEVTAALFSFGFTCVKSIEQLEGRTFCKDSDCHDLLVFQNSSKRELSNSGLLRDHRLVMQDKSCCVAPSALRILVQDGGDVLLVGCFSAESIAHIAAVTQTLSSSTKLQAEHTHASNTPTVMVSAGEERSDELQRSLCKLGCRNVKLLAQSLESLEACDVRLQKLSLVYVRPQCSLSAVSNPVEYILQENRDPRIMLDLVQGSVSAEKLHGLVDQQRALLQRSMQSECSGSSTIPRSDASRDGEVTAQCVCSSSGAGCAVLHLLPSPRGERVAAELRAHASLRNHTTAPVLRAAVPSPLPERSLRAGGGAEEKQVLQAGGLRSAQRLLPRSAHTTVKETPQEVLDRAAAKGLLDGFQPSRPIRKRGRRTRKVLITPGRSTRPQPIGSQSEQSMVAEFLSREWKGSRSEPALSDNSRKLTNHNDKAVNSRRTFHSHSLRSYSATNDPTSFSRLKPASKSDHNPNPLSSTSSMQDSSFHFFTHNSSPKSSYQNSTQDSTHNSIHSAAHAIFNLDSTIDSTHFLSHNYTHSHSPIHIPTSLPTHDSAPLPSSNRKSLTRLVDSAISPNHIPVAPPPFACKPRKEVLRPTTLSFPAVLMSSVSVISGSWSQVTPIGTSPAQVSSPPLHRSHAPLQTKRNRLQPWF